MSAVARSCRYRPSVGGVHHDLVLSQRRNAGGRRREARRRFGGAGVLAPERADQGRAAQAPGGMPLAQTHHVRLRNPQDAFGNARLPARSYNPQRRTLVVPRCRYCGL